MKSAEEWSKELSGWKYITPETVRAIQVDALYHAANFIGDMPKKYNRMRAWDGPYRAACVFGRSHLREMAADLIRTINPEYDTAPNVATSFDKPTE